MEFLLKKNNEMAPFLPAHVHGCFSYLYTSVRAEGGSKFGNTGFSSAEAFGSQFFPGGFMYLTFSED